jgi:SAM-dependent methyltransferase
MGSTHVVAAVRADRRVAIGRGNMPDTGRPDGAWALGDAYEPYVGRWSRLVAAAFLDWLAVPAGQRWLDVGCGTGALTSTVLERAQPASVIGLDASDGYVAHVRSRVDDARATFQVGNALDLPFEPGAFDAAVSGLVLNFVADPGMMVREMARVTGNGGCVAVYVWDYAGDMQLMRAFWDAAAALDPDAAALDEGTRFPLCQPQPLQDLFTHSGLSGVQATAIDVPTVFRDFDDYWTPFLGGQGPAPGYAMSLSEERRAALREHLRMALPPSPDGSIRLHARAWAVKGTR